ncbi:hypothetical protein Avbf_02242 [Armadillidium vulgare]|nr:hypothetical protein Avbf_02242 [Armadillidium vulgare]
MNRYGKQVCMDDSPRSGGLSCPLIPRMNVDCSDDFYFTRRVAHKSCRSDKDCPARTKCCYDICSENILKCLPGDFLGYFIPS